MEPLLLEITEADGGWALVYGDRHPSVERFANRAAAIERARFVARAAAVVAQIRIRAPGQADVSEWIHPLRTGLHQTT
ncbi:MAG: hypothetical protein IT302_10390 [Dehalococcoidia bacterium]|nr:hypothetical protein [Dehalococcoidia bacterium]